MASLNLDRFFCPVSPVISISHFLTCCKCQMRTYVKLNKVTQLCPTLWDPMDCSPPGPSIHEYFPGKNTRVGCHSLLQGIFPTQESNPDLLHYRQTLYHLSHKGRFKLKKKKVTALSRYNSPPMQFTHLRCTIQCFF